MIQKDKVGRNDPCPYERKIRKLRLLINCFFVTIDIEEKNGILYRNININNAKMHKKEVFKFLLISRGFLQLQLMKGIANKLSNNT